jgi:hypothetical protein
MLDATGADARPPRHGRATGQTAVERQLRVLCTATGPTALVFGLLALSTYQAQMWLPAPFLCEYVLVCNVLSPSGLGF